MKSGRKWFSLFAVIVLAVVFMFLQGCAAYYDPGYGGPGYRAHPSYRGYGDYYGGYGYDYGGYRGYGDYYDCY